MNKEELFGFKRLNRVKYLAFSGSTMIIGILVQYFAVKYLPYFEGLYSQLVIPIVCLLVIVKFTAQRYMDVGAGAYWAILMLTPTAPVIFVICGLIRGDPVPNEYGQVSSDGNLLLKTIAVVSLLSVIGLVSWQGLSLTKPSI